MSSQHLFVTLAFCQCTVPARNRVNLVCCRVSDTLLNAQVGSAVTLLSTHTVNLSTFVSIIACFLEIQGKKNRTLLARHMANPCPFQFLLKRQQPALEYPSRIIHSSSMATWAVLTHTHNNIAFFHFVLFFVGFLFSTLLHRSPASWLWFYWKQKRAKLLPCEDHKHMRQ